jgi:hypothetical protein
MSGNAGACARATREKWRRGDQTESVIYYLYFASQKPAATNIVDDIFNKYRQR